MTFQLTVVVSPHALHLIGLRCSLIGRLWLEALGSRQFVKLLAFLSRFLSIRRRADTLCVINYQLYIKNKLKNANFVNLGILGYKGLFF
jgi:hypothetical protein